MSHLFAEICLPLCQSTKPAPPVFRLAEEMVQHCPSPAPCSLFPHPLQNRVPRVRVLLPLPKTGGNTAFLPVFFFHMLYDYGVHAGSDIVLLHPVAPALTCSHPLQHPKRTRFCLFRLNPGAFSRFSHFWTCKIFGTFFVHSAA